MSRNINLENPIFQSPYTYLQSAGSNGLDGTLSGIHLRWDFFRDLGDEHLPKGNLAAGFLSPYRSSLKYNKVNDFVNIYRAPFKDACFVHVKLSDTPNKIISNNNEIKWHYTREVMGVEETSFTTILLHFKDINLYNYVAQEIDPNNDPLEFLSRYNGIIHISTRNKLLFRGIFTLDKNLRYDEKTEGISTGIEAISLIHHNFDAVEESDKYYISCRKKIDPTNFEEKTQITCENIEFFRFRGNQFLITEIILFTYEDYVKGINREFQYLDSFSLSEDVNVVYKRLEETLGSINGEWPKFYHENINGRELKIKIENYKDRWEQNFGLGDAVHQYLQLSRLDSQAIDYLDSNDPNDAAKSQISYLEILKLVATDYHVARMLGLGHIDVEISASEQEYIYVMEYETDVAIENVVEAQNTTHLFMTLPTSVKDFRKPPTPILKPISYGIESNELHNTPFSLTDEYGYSKYSNERFINLSREEFLFERIFEEFFATDEEFCSCHQSMPIGYGVEYKLSNESQYRMPNINHDFYYNDHTGIPETIFIPDNGNKLIYTHIEEEQGVHSYAIYSINWFSRISDLSNVQITDNTIFSKKNFIIPPTNLAVQLIQEESPLIFTTEAEQQKLLNLNTLDKTLTRVTFDWNHIHNRNYQFANYVEFLFRKNEPSSVRGKVSQVNTLADGLIRISTQPLRIESTTPPQTIQPYISSSDKIKYIGSVFLSEEKSYIIEDIIEGNNPTFILKPIRETAVTDVDNNNIFSHTNLFISPNIGASFLVIENLDLDINWDSKLKRKVYLEQFHTVSEIEIENGQNSMFIPLNYVNFLEDRTTLHLDQEVSDNLVFHEIFYPKTVKVISHNVSEKTFTVQGNISSEITIGSTIKITASNTIDGIYTISRINIEGNNTKIRVNEAFNEGNLNFYLILRKRVPVIQRTSNSITIQDNFVDEIIPPYKELELRGENTSKYISIGGLLKKANITEYEDKDENGYNILGSKTGIYSIIIRNYNLPNHIDTSIEWYKGFVRVMEDSMYLPTTLESHRNTPEMKELQVLDIINGGNDLTLIVADSSFNVDNNYYPIDNYVPILTGNNININFHPSYRLYLYEDTLNGNNFNELSILPQSGGVSKYTYLSARAIDSSLSPIMKSYITRPATIIAQEINEPLSPGQPDGPLYATRPDFYGKATYTFDIKINTMNNRVPHMLLCYRTNESQILYQLYKTSTVQAIIIDLENLDQADKAFINNRWNDLVNVNLDDNELFPQYVNNGYRFPIPDNNLYKCLDNNGDTIFPFHGQSMPSALVIKNAINETFIPLTEQPITYNFIKNGKQTSSIAPQIRDANGNIFSTSDVKFNPSPMAVKFIENNETYIRFTDYQLDGASKNMFFYCAAEVSNQLKISNPSPINGPISLVNSFPAEEPIIKKVSTKLIDQSINQAAAIYLEINEYLPNEEITKINIYRSNDASDALSIRNMKLVKTVSIADEVIDDFSDVPFPLYGEPLFYKVVAVREIKNEYGVIEYIPSKASNTILTNIVDNINPAPPHLSFNGDFLENEIPKRFDNAILSWQPTCYNGTYHLYTMTSFGTWQKIYQVKSNDNIISVSLSLTNLNTSSIFKENEDGDVIYKRFRVEVENSSGLFNIIQHELTI